MPYKPRAKQKSDYTWVKEFVANKQAVNKPQEPFRYNWESPSVAELQNNVLSDLPPKQVDVGQPTQQFPEIWALPPFSPMGVPTFMPLSPLDGGKLPGVKSTDIETVRGSRKDERGNIVVDPEDVKQTLESNKIDDEILNSLLTDSPRYKPSIAELQNNVLSDLPNYKPSVAELQNNVQSKTTFEKASPAGLTAQKPDAQKFKDWLKGAGWSKEKATEMLISDIQAKSSQPTETGTPGFVSAMNMMATANKYSDILNVPGQYLDKAINQFTSNPLASVLNVGLGLTQVPMSVINAGIEGMSDLGFSAPKNAMETGMNAIAGGYNYAGSAIDKGLETAGVPKDIIKNEFLGELKEPLDEINIMAGLALATGGIGKGIKKATGVQGLSLADAKGTKGLEPLKGQRVPLKKKFEDWLKDKTDTAIDDIFKDPKNVNARGALSDKIGVGFSKKATKLKETFQKSGYDNLDDFLSRYPKNERDVVRNMMQEDRISFIDYIDQLEKKYNKVDSDLRNGKSARQTANDNGVPVREVAKRQRELNASPRVEPKTDSPVLRVNAEKQTSDMPTLAEFNEKPKLLGEAKPEPAKPVEAEKPAPKAKEPWEMTRREFEKTDGYQEEIIGGSKAQFNFGEINNDLTDKWVYTRDGGKGLRRYVSHKKAVQKALSEGKTVPQEVLKDYPDLQPKAEVKAQPKELNFRAGGLEQKPQYAKHAKIIEEVLDLRDIRKDKKPNPTAKRKAIKQIRELTSQVPGLIYEFKGDNLYLEENKVSRYTKTERVKVEDVTIENPDATKSFEKLPEKKALEQEYYAQYVESNMLEKGIGKKTAEKGLEDIRKDAGREQSKEAQIVRDMALEIQKGIEEQGYIEYSVPGAKGKTRFTKEDFDRGFDEYVKQKMIREDPAEQLKIKQRELEDLQNDTFATDAEIKAKQQEVDLLSKEISKLENEGDTSFNFGANVKKPQIERTSAGDQYTLGSEFKPQFPNTAKASKGEGKGAEGTPLFEQKATDKNQFNAFNDKFANDNYKVSEESYKEAKKNISDKGSQINAGVDPTILADYVKIGAYHFERGLNKFRLWAKKMIAEFGDKIRPKLRKLWDGVKTELAKGLVKAYEKNPFTRPQKIMPDELFGKPTKTPKQRTDMPLDLPEETLTGLIDRKLFDKENRIKQISERAEVKGDLPDNANPGLRAELYIGRAKAQIDDLEKKVSNGKDGFLERLSDAGFSIGDLGDFLYASHAIERNQFIKAQNPKIESGSGMDDATAQKLLDHYKNSGIDKFANEFQTNYVEPQLAFLRQNGIITQETYDKLRSQYQNYVPLKGTTKTQRAVNSKGYSVSHSGIMKAKGRGSLADNPVVQAILDFENNIVRVEKNNVAKSLLELVEKYPDALNEAGEPLWKVENQRYMPEYNKYGEEQYLKKLIKVEDNQVSALVDGKQKIITINDAVLAKQMRNLGVENSYKVLQAVNSVIRSTATYYNPEFWITNFQRDIGAAALNISSDKSVALGKAVAKDAPKAIVGVFKHKRGSKGSQEWQKWAKSYGDRGGNVSWLNIGSVDQKVAAFEKKIKNYQRAGRPMQAVKAVAQYVDDLNSAIELGTRVSVYKNLVEAGMSKDKAASYAKNVTVNFNAKGEYGTALNSAYLFWNAGAQGSKRFFKSTRTKRGRKIALGLVALSTAQNLMNKFLADDKWDYNELDDGYKDTNFMFMIPGEDKHVKIKYPYGWNIFHVMGNIIGDVMTGDTSPGDVFKRAIMGASDAFNPFGYSESWGQLISPTATDLFYQIAMNENTWGQPFKKDQPQFSPLVPNSQLYFDSVNPYIKATTTWFNTATGGNDKLSGVIDVNPEDVEHIINFFGTGTSKFVSNILKTGDDVFQGETPEVNKIPFVRQFVGGKNSYVEKSIVYDMLNESKRTKFSQRDKGRFREALNRMRKEKEITLDEYRKYLKEFNKNQR